ncbi:MAG TPA: LLM class flavin-dependent oxidoreductase [Acidimicrobiia bacterium]|nr:LLM class flavin-dependent oxidoreductase [Acidimicrobiia bacterium]
MRVGVLILPDDRWAIAADRWRRAEALGFDHAWTFDHIAWGDLRDSPWFAAMPTLTAAATATSRLRIGTLVASPNFRHPVPLAREVITLDDISQGRLTVGVGAGSHGWDATMMGQTPWSVAERADRFVEFVELLDLLLRNLEVSYQGRYWNAHEARTHPGCFQSPRTPFAIAATGARSMRSAARHAATWVTNGDRSHQGPPMAAEPGAAVVARQMTSLEQACLAEGRDPASIDRLVLTGQRLDSGLASTAAFDEVKSAYREVGVTDLVIPWPRPADPYRGDESILERIVG